MLTPIILGLVLLIVVVSANSMKKKGSMTESAYQNVVSVASIIVTLAAIAALVMRLKR